MREGNEGKGWNKGHRDTEDGREKGTGLLLVL